MNRNLYLLLLTLLVASSANAELVAPVESAILQRNAQAKTIDSNSVLVAYTQRLFGSCGYDATTDLAMSMNWEKITREPDYLLITYRSEVAFTILGREYRIKELLVPLPSQTWPSYLYGRSGDKIYAFSKFGPRQLADVVCDEPIGYKNTSPYQAICDNRHPSPL